MTQDEQDFYLKQIIEFVKLYGIDKIGISERNFLFKYNLFDDQRLKNSQHIYKVIQINYSLATGKNS